METRNDADHSVFQTDRRQGSTIECELGELIYTSAPKVLKSQSGHLGIVAETRDFPSEIERQLARFWSYSLPPELKVPETQLVPRFVLAPVGGGAQAICLTRVQSAGFDHTGRTHPIAHHFVAELADLESNDLGIADLVLWAAGSEKTGKEPVFLNRWNGEPAYLEKRTLACSKVASSPFSAIDAIRSFDGLDRNVIEEAVLATVDTLRDYNLNQRMVVVVVRPTYASSILDFIGAVLCALPRRKQAGVTAISHVWEINDAPSGYSLAFTYPRSPYLERINERIDSKKPLIIDLAMKIPAVPRAESPYVTFVRNDCDRWNAKVNLPIPRLIDRVDPAGDFEVAAFEFKRVLIDWEANKSHELLAALCITRRSGISKGLRAAAVDGLVRRAGETTVKHLVTSRNWMQLLGVYRDASLPNELRLVAWNAIEQHISLITETRPDLIAQATLEPDGMRLTKLLANRDEISIDPVLSEANAGAASLPNNEARSGAANWAVLGTRVLRRAWDRISAALSAGEAPSQFYRRILDRVIPMATVRNSKSIPPVAVSESESKEVPGLESVLAPAWRIVSHQIRAGEAPPGLCKQIVDELVESADVTGSVEAVPRTALGDIGDGEQEILDA